MTKVKEAWREELIPINEFSRPGLPLKLVRNIVVHYTGNRGASAANHVIYFGKSMPEANRKIIEQAERLPEPQKAQKLKEVRYASAHLFVDPLDAALLIPLSEMAYHASQANAYSIGVEMCIEPDGSFHPDTVKRTVQIVAELCQLYGLNPLRDVIRHYDVTGKICPKPYVDDHAAWETFQQSVERKMKGEKDEPMGKMELELKQWRMLGDALTGISQLPQEGSHEPVLSYEWAKKAYSQDMDISEGLYIVMVALARLHGITVEMRDV